MNNICSENDMVPILDFCDFLHPVSKRIRHLPPCAHDVERHGPMLFKYGNSCLSDGYV